MNLLYPKIKLASLPFMIGVSVYGALIAGLYGILHDQITYSISPEYFTKLKFAQFHYADFGLPDRFFAGTIGFLSSWWVGFAAAWFLARTTLPHWKQSIAFKKCLFGFGIILGSAVLAGITGWLLAALQPDENSTWTPGIEELGVIEPRSFVTVAYIHNAGYIGGMIGLIAALLLVRRQKMNGKAAAAQGSPD